MEGDRIIIASDHVDESDIMLGEIVAGEKSEWVGQKISSLSQKFDVKCLVIRRDGKDIVPDDDAVILSRDSLIVFRHGGGGRM